MSTSRADTPGGPPSAPVVERRSDRVKLRRGLTYTLMTLLLPGSAQIAGGNRRVGRIALRIWAGLWIGLLAFGLLALLWRNGAIAVLTFGPTLRLVQGMLILLGIAWGLLFVDAWRISRPVELARRHRLGFAMLNLALVFTVVGGLVASASVVSAQRSLLASIFSGGGDRASHDGRLNILLLGGDAGKTRVGLRPDSMTVASVDENTGRTVLFSLPRNLEDVPFPMSSPLHKRFPKGYGCPDHTCMLNAVYTYASEHKSLYPGVQNPGVEATKEAIEGATGLKINYYVLVDLKGFESLVNAVGGVTLDVNKRVPIGGGTSRVFGYIEPGKNLHMDGYHALWFARSRSDSSDYERIARQKCVMSAMLNQLDPVTVLTKFNQIAAAGKQIMATDIPASDLNTLMDLALKAKTLPVSSLAFVPPLIYPGSPDFDLVRSKVRAKIAGSEAVDSPIVASAKPSAASPKPHRQATPKRTATVPPGQETDNLSSVCLAR